MTTTELQHIEAIEKEYNQIETTNAWNQVYQKVRSEGSYDFALSAARSAVNRPLNRYRDVLPYDHSRIILKHPSTDYINASLVKVESIGRQYILTQGPLSSTSQHFWLMVWQQECKAIIMLNKVIEKNMIKCHQYWPLGEKHGGQDTIEYPNVDLKVDLISEMKHHHYIYRTLRLTQMSTGISREVLHFHYVTWPDFGVPQSPEAFSKFLNVVLKSGCLSPSVGPPIVHCSAGIGRSGTFCLVDTLLVMLERGLCSSNNVGTVLEVLLDMRRYRMGLIQTPDQLRFSYLAIVHGAKQRHQRFARLQQHVTLNTSTDDSTEQQPTNGSLGNGNNGHYEDSDSSSTCSDSADANSDDEPPPLPPPRNDSLTRSMIEAQLEARLEPGSDEEESEEEDEEDSEASSSPVDLGNNVLHESLTAQHVAKTSEAVPTTPDQQLPPVPPSPPDDEEEEEEDKVEEEEEEETPPPPPRRRGAPPPPPPTDSSTEEDCTKDGGAKSEAAESVVATPVDATTPEQLAAQMHEGSSSEMVGRLCSSPAAACRVDTSSSVRRSGTTKRPLDCDDSFTGETKLPSKKPKD